MGEGSEQSHIELFKTRVFSFRHRCKKRHQRMPNCTDIMNPQDLYALRCQRQRNADGASQPISFLIPNDVRDKTFTRMSDEQRTAQVVESIAIPGQHDVVFMGFSKSNSRIETNPGQINARRHKRISPGPEISKDVLDDVAIRRVVLHRLRRALHVHGADSASRLVREGYHFRILRGLSRH